MKKIITLIAACAVSMPLSFQSLADITLPAPDKSGGSSLMKALDDRHSTRAFDTRPISESTLSSLLWAACGVNRPNGRRTAPSALNGQEIDVYVATADGAFLYDAAGNKLIEITKEDVRPLVAGPQKFVVDAPVSLIMVADESRFGATDPMTFTMMAVDAGIVCENINLFCSAFGLATVPRAWMDTEGLKKALKLKDSQTPMMNNPIGFPKAE